MNQNWKMTQKTIQSKSQEMKKAASRMMEIKRQPNQVPYIFSITKQNVATIISENPTSSSFTRNHAPGSITVLISVILEIIDSSSLRSYYNIYDL